MTRMPLDRLNGAFDIPGRVAALEALQSADDGRVERHELTSAERWRSVDDRLNRVNERIDKLGFAAWGATITALMTLVAVIAQITLHTH